MATAPATTAALLLVEDDVAIGRAVTQGLAAAGHAVTWQRSAARVAQTLGEMIAAGERVVLVLDVGLPDGCGMELCRNLRAQGHTLPILMLTARAALDDRIEGFDAGADDYLPKPFAFAELVARVGVLARRARQLPLPPVRLGLLEVDVAQARARWGDAALPLDPRALALLARLARAQGQVVEREALIDAVWGADAAVGDNTVDVAISALRRRIAEVTDQLAVRAVKGQGFRLDCAEQR
ncbi:MAG TPA: response regulator transcription factor [Novosphingobium sp.]|nr:response regulator transcription factor [Novosphingobium sp.]